LSNATINAQPEVAALAQYMERRGNAELIQVDVSDDAENFGRKQVPLLVVPSISGREIHSLVEHIDEHRIFPRKREGRAALETIESLIDHANRFKDSASALFAHLPASLSESPTLQCVLDYHHGSNGAPRNLKHRGIYKFDLSEPWKTWLVSNEKWMKMGQLAEFLEDNVMDLAEPTGTLSKSVLAFQDKLNMTIASPAHLMATAREFSVNVNRSVKNATNIGTGEVQLLFQEGHEIKGTMEVPTAFAISIPIFRNALDWYQIPARLRYRVVEGSVQFMYKLHQPEKLIEFAFNEACMKVKAKTELPLFFGSPE
jgi:uncharacterized protein YfdQ (DUF2303 family)